VQLGGRAVPLRVVDAVRGFFAVYVGVFAGLGATGKWICVTAMLLGRLEIFTLLILFTVTFRRK
jgi:Trk-type K+ transport system membrane component